MKKLWLFGLFSGDKGDYIDVDDQNYHRKKSNMIWMFASSKVDNIQKPSLSLKSGFFLFVHWFVNLTLTDKHGTKNL